MSPEAKRTGNKPVHVQTAVCRTSAACTVESTYEMKFNQEAWRPYQNRIRTLYLDENQSVADVKRIIEKENNFSASLSQYHHHIKHVLKLRKNLSKDDINYYERVKRKRDEEGKETRVKLCGVLLDEANMRRKCQRKHYTILEQFEREKKLDTAEITEIPSTPPGFEVGTPSACSSPKSPGSHARLLPSASTTDTGDDFDMLFSDSDVEDYIVGEGIWGQDFNMIWSASFSRSSVSCTELDLTIFLAIRESDISQFLKVLKLKHLNFDHLVGEKMVCLEIAARFGRLGILALLLQAGASRNLNEAIRIASRGHPFPLARYIKQYSLGRTVEVLKAPMNEMGPKSTSLSHSDCLLVSQNGDEFEEFVNWSPKSNSSR